MSDAALWHRLYTHAGAIGGRIVAVERDAARVLTAEATKHLDDLLKKTRGGVVVRRYGAFACVIASHEASDAGGRRGVRNHARLCEERMFDVAALMDLATSEAFEERIAIESRPFPEAMFVRDFLAALLTTHGKRERLRVRIEPPRLAATAATAWAALPLALQQGGSWAVDTGDGCPVDLVLSAGEGRAVSEAVPAPMIDLATRYVERLFGGDGAFRAILRNPAISSAARLADALRGEGWR